MLAETWRLLDTGSFDGPTNMAIDEALLASFDHEKTTPVLRLYGWSPPALSLGRFQNAAEVLDLDRCREAGVTVVRRITGGGVIYHAEELTYSLVCAPRHLPNAASIKESFRFLTTFLLRFYRDLGLAAAYAVDCLPAGSRLGVRTDFCFAGKETYDILINGKKIGGNAQRRLKHAIFQHGSIPLRDMIGEGVRFLRDIPPELAATTTSLGELGIVPAEPCLKAQLAEAFQQGLGVTLAAAGLTPAEEERVQVLLEKYRGDGWNVAGI